MQQLGFVVGQRSEQFCMDALGADDREGREADIVEAVLTVVHRRYGHRSFSAGEDTFHDMADRDSDSVEGSALTSDDLAAGFTDVVFDLFMVELRNQVLIGVSEAVAVLIDRDIGDSREGPRNKGGIAVFAVNIRMNILEVDRVISAILARRRAVSRIVPEPRI